jgi:GAF domain-containing protein
VDTRLLDLDSGPDTAAPPRPRVLVFGPVSPASQFLADADTVRLGDAKAVADALHDGGFSAVVADPAVLTAFFDEYRRNALILSHAARGIAFTDLDGRVVWANPKLHDWCTADPVGRHLLAGLDAPTASSELADPMAALRRGESVSVRVHRTAGDPEYVEIIAHPVFAPDGTVCQFLALCRNVSAEVEQQQKLDALHLAGNELVELDAATIAEVSLPERIESLKDNLRRLIHNLLHYDIIEVRLYDRRTNELRPLLEEGMTREAADRRLEASPTGNGITGWVAYHRKSYLCADAASDPKYLTGATGARSSLTVPLVYANELVGTFNVESPRVNGFNEEDLQFSELFSKEIAAALHTLDLLTAQQSCAASHSVELVSREIALPLDEVIASAAVLLKQLGDRDDVVVKHLRKIVDNARQVKTSVRRVGDQATNVAATPAPRPLANKRVLVIEQEARLRREAHQVLERLGAMAETVGTASEGLALLAGVEYDAVLTEVRPIDLGGYATYKAIRQIRPGVPVAMTNVFGHESDHSVLKARADGMKHLIFKPFKPNQVVMAVLDTPR